MKQAYRIADRKDNRALAESGSREVQLVLLAITPIEQAEMAVEQPIEEGVYLLRRQTNLDELERIGFPFRC